MADRPYMTLAVDPVRNDRTKLIATWHLLIRRGRGVGGANQAGSRLFQLI